MNTRMTTACVVASIATLFIGTALAAINRVRVVNSSDATIYIHKGGYAPSVKLPPGQWKIFHYPFEVIPPGTSKKVSSGLITASAGGRWMTTPNGYTYLDKPTMLICLNYASPEHSHKTGNRVWTIKRASGVDRNCKVKGYRQPWYQPSS